MKLDDYKDLESLAAKNGAHLVDAKDMLVWREILLHARRMYVALKVINTIGVIRTGEFRTQELVDAAPDEVKS